MAWRKFSGEGSSWRPGGTVAQFSTIPFLVHARFWRFPQKGRVHASNTDSLSDSCNQRKWTIANRSCRTFSTARFRFTLLGEAPPRAWAKNGIVLATAMREGTMFQLSSQYH